MKSALSQKFCDSADRFSLTVFQCVSKIAVGYRRQQWTMKTRNGFDHPLLLLYLYPVLSGSFDPIAGEDCLLLLFQNKNRCGRSGNRGVGAPFRSETTGRTRQRKAPPDPISRSGRKEKKTMKAERNNQRKPRGLPRAAWIKNQPPLRGAGNAGSPPRRTDRQRSGSMGGRPSGPCAEALLKAS